MTKTIPRSAIVRQYCREGTAEQVALALTYFYRKHDIMIRPIYARDVERVWAEEFAVNVVMRELGERPPGGFKPCEKTQVAEALVA